MSDLIRPAHFSAAILIGQHLPENFTAVLAAQLHQQVALTVREVAEGDCLKPGVALVAPGGSHLLLGSDACGHCTKEPEVARRLLLTSWQPGRDETW